VKSGFGAGFWACDSTSTLSRIAQPKLFAEISDHLRFLDFTR
jgi:hypothetical protein